MKEFVVTGSSGQSLHANASQTKAERLSEINRLRRQLDEAEAKILGQAVFNSGALYEAPDDELASDRYEAANASAGGDYQAPDV